MSERARPPLQKTNYSTRVPPGRRANLKIKVIPSRKTTVGVGECCVSWLTGLRQSGSDENNQITNLPISRNCPRLVPFFLVDSWLELHTIRTPPDRMTDEIYPSPLMSRLIPALVDLFNGTLALDGDSNRLKADTRGSGNSETDPFL